MMKKHDTTSASSFPRRRESIFICIAFPRLRLQDMDPRLREGDASLHVVIQIPSGSRTVHFQISMQPAVYILASKLNGTLYIGVTSDLIKRIYEHRTDAADGFTKKHGVHDLVFFEIHETMESAIQREKQLKHWERAWKIRLIEERNPSWADLWPTIANSR